MCGRGFARRGPGAPLRCPRCRGRAAAGSAKMLRARCGECGRTFRTRSRSVRYCSEPCRKAGYGRGRHRDRPPRRPGTTVRTSAARAGARSRRRAAPANAARTRAGQGGTGASTRLPIRPRPSARPSAARAAGRSGPARGPGSARRTARPPAGPRARGPPAARSGAGTLPTRKRMPSRRRAAAPSRRRQAAAARDRFALCMECGREFSPPRQGTMYCSPPCRKASRLRINADSCGRRRRRLGTRTARCGSCSAEFAPGHGEGRLRRYCSLACRAKAKLVSDRESKRRKRLGAAA